MPQLPPRVIEAPAGCMDCMKGCPLKAADCAGDALKALDAQRLYDDPEAAPVVKKLAARAVECRSRIVSVIERHNERMETVRLTVQFLESKGAVIKPGQVARFIPQAHDGQDPVEDEADEGETAEVHVIHESNGNGNGSHSNGAAAKTELAFASEADERFAAEMEQRQKKEKDLFGYTISPHQDPGTIEEFKPQWAKVFSEDPFQAVGPVVRHNKATGELHVTFFYKGPTTKVAAKLVQERMRDFRRDRKNEARRRSREEERGGSMGETSAVEAEEAPAVAGAA